MISGLLNISGSCDLSRVISKSCCDVLSKNKKRSKDINTYAIIILINLY